MGHELCSTRLFIKINLKRLKELFLNWLRVSFLTVQTKKVFEKRQNNKLTKNEEQRALLCQDFRFFWPTPESRIDCFELTFR